MTAPIRLADASGTVRAWACGTCGVAATSGGEPMFMPTLDDVAEDTERARRRAESCCTCHECSGANPRGSSWLTRCRACSEKDAARGARPLADWSDVFCRCGARLDDDVLCDRCMAAGREGLAALACIGMAVAARGLMSNERPGPNRVVHATAALCGVDVETVRGWR